MNSGTFYGLKIGSLLTEIQPLLYRKYKTQLFYKCKPFLSLPTDRLHQKGSRKIRQPTNQPTMALLELINLPIKPKCLTNLYHEF